MFFLIFLELHLLDLCVDMAESLSKWLFNRSVWKNFLTCVEKYFSSHVMVFSVMKKNLTVVAVVLTGGLDRLGSGSAVPSCNTRSADRLPQT